MNSHIYSFGLKVPSVSHLLVMFSE